MNDDTTLVMRSDDESAPRRKPWQMPQIEDVSVAVSTAKNASNAETTSGKPGS